MTWRAFILAALVASAALADRDVELIPPPGDHAPVPTCRLVRTDTDIVLLYDQKEIKRFRHSQGANFVDSLPGQDKALLVALQTLEAMKKAGACH